MKNETGMDTTKILRVIKTKKLKQRRDIFNFKIITEIILTQNRQKKI